MALINKYGASREMEVSKTAQRKEMSGVITARQRATARLKEKDKDDVNGWGEKKVSRYLWNPPAGPHQKTAYLSATLMSSNRPGTVVNTEEEHLSHTPAADLAASRCGSPDCHKKLGVCHV